MSSPAARSPRIAALALCCCGLCRPAVAADSEADLATLESVNATVNHRVSFSPDISNWGRADHWATPDELFARGAGDCEDYAIAKYFALRAAGLPEKQLRLVYVLALAGGTGDSWRAHLVVAYLPSNGGDGEARILDSLLDEVRPLSRRPDLRARISFDTEGIWPGLDRGSPAREASLIKPWAQVLERMALSH